MANLYEALMGSTPAPGGADSRLLAEKLRQRETLGQIGMLTGDKPVSALGKNLVTGSREGATQIGANVQKEDQRRVLEDYYKAQEERWKAKEAFDRDKLEQDRILKEADIQQRADAAELKASTKDKTYRKMTDNTRKQISTASETMFNTQHMLDRFQDNYSQILGAGPQSKLATTASNLGIGTENSKEAGEWWGNWKLFYTLGTRNRLFGATLTPSEQKAWDQADINEAMSPDQIRVRVNNLLEASRTNNARLARTLDAEGYNPDTLDAVYGDTVTDWRNPDAYKVIISDDPTSARTSADNTVDTPDTTGMTDRQRRIQELRNQLETEQRQTTAEGA